MEPTTIAVVSSLILSLYATEASMLNDKPETAVSYYSSHEECNAERAKMIPELDEKLANGLLAYSITCQTK
jgi:hypothetical protein